MHLSDANKEKQIDNYVAMVTKSVTIETNLLIIYNIFILCPSK
jgi:hypothetical protein